MSEFSDNLHEVFAPFGRVTLRRMFGGHGIYHEGRMFALVLRERLYLKSDAQSAPAFEARRLAPFEYVREGRTMRMSYREAPAEMFDDRDEALHWARMAWEAALRSGTAPRAARDKASKASNAVAAKPAKARAAKKVPVKTKAPQAKPAKKS